jgi:nucleoid-associated protein YgaU
MAFDQLAPFGGVTGILRLLLPGPAPAPDRQMPKVTITAGQRSVTLAITSPETDLGEWADDWRVVPRPGLKPVLQRAGGKLQTRTIEAIHDHDYGFNVEEDIGLLGDFCRYDFVTVGYSTMEAGHWVITSMQVKVLRRGPNSQHVTRAKITLVLTQPNSPPIPTTTAPSVAAPSAPAAAASSVPAVAAPARRYTVVAGDTLWAIAVRTYGNGAKWTAIASANGIADPRKLAVGQILTLP